MAAVHTPGSLLFVNPTNPNGSLSPHSCHKVALGGSLEGKDYYLQASGKLQKTKTAPILGGLAVA